MAPWHGHEAKWWALQATELPPTLLKQKGKLIGLTGKSGSEFKLALSQLDLEVQIPLGVFFIISQLCFPKFASFKHRCCWDGKAFPMSIPGLEVFRTEDLGRRVTFYRKEPQSDTLSSLLPREWYLGDWHPARYEESSSQKKKKKQDKKVIC